MKKLEKPKKIAIVYDKITKFGGAERILIALHELWPEAAIFTTLYKRNKTDWAKGIRIFPSILNKFPLLNQNPEILFSIMSFVFEQFDFTGTDIVIDVTSSDAKALITKPGTLHICYCLTPTRYLWSGYLDYINQPGFGLLNPIVRSLMKMSFTNLRLKDFINAQKPDYFISISKTVSDRLFRYYRLRSDVVYPPVDTEEFYPSTNLQKGKYYLIVSRLVPYKNIDYAIEGFNKSNRRLIIIGDGIDKRRLQTLAKGNIQFIDSLTDKELCCYYQNCKALIFPGEEDFGLTAVEAQACGKPVIGLGSGGTKESVVLNRTGLFYEEPQSQYLNRAIDRFEGMHISTKACRNNALNFSLDRFKRIISHKINEYWMEYNKTL